MLNSGAYKEAEPATGHDLIARQEAVWALQWLSEQWRFHDKYDYGDGELEWLLEEPTASVSILRTRDEMGQLTQAPLEKVVAALHDRDIAVRLAALDALLKISSAGEGVSHHVAEMLRDPCQQVRWKTEETLLDMVFNKVSNGVQEDDDCGDVPF